MRHDPGAFWAPADAVTLKPKEDTVEEAIRDQTEGNAGVDVALECVGAEAALATCIECARRQGVVVPVGLQWESRRSTASR